MPADRLSPAAAARRHLRFGWWSLLVFLSLGFVLEMLHGFKAGLYLDVSNETRRLMWTLAHAHGGLLGLIHVVFGLVLRVAPEAAPRRLPAASASLIGASFLLPGGFFLGGAAFYDGDPGLGILAVPAGAALLATAVYAAARGTARLDESGDEKGKTREPGARRGRAPR